MKRNTKMAVVLSALVALTMAFAGCGKNDSSSKADTSSAASSAADSSAAESKAEESKAEESKAEESKAEESKAEESQAEAPAESEAEAPAESEAPSGQTAVDTEALTASVWTSASFVKEDQTVLTPDQFAEEQGVEVSMVASNLAFGADGTFVMANGTLGTVVGTWTVSEDGNTVITKLSNGTDQVLEMGVSEGNAILSAEEEKVDPENGIKATVYAANPALDAAQMLANAAEGGEEAAEGEEAGAEGEEAGAEGEEAGAEGEEAAE